MVKKPKILLIRTDRIGDVTLTTPSVSALRAGYPGSGIYFLTSSYACGVLENNGDLDGIITEKGFFSTLKELRRGKFDIAVIFFLNFKVALLAFLAGIPLRIGPASKLWAVFLNKPVFQHRSEIKKHEADYNLDLLAGLGVEPRPGEAKINPGAAERDSALRVLARLGLKPGDFIIGIHPCSGGSALNWPGENFAGLAGRLLKEFNVRILLTGSPSETPVLEEISAGVAGKTFILREALTLPEFIGVIARCNMFITNSTGPLHLASALRVPTLSFFPPIKACSPLRWGPYGKGLNKVLVPSGAGCPRCEREKCPRYSCMAEITVEDAFKASAGILKTIHMPSAGAAELNKNDRSA